MKNLNRGGEKTVTILRVENNGVFVVLALDGGESLLYSTMLRGFLGFNVRNGLVSWIGKLAIKVSL